MRMLAALLWIIAAASAARADDIVSVLERSQRSRLEQLVAAPDTERT
jgi:hypothetical protein